MCERHYNPLFVNNQDRVEMARLVPNETGKLETGCEWMGGGRTPQDFCPRLEQG